MLVNNQSLCMTTDGSAVDTKITMANCSKSSNQLFKLDNTQRLTTQNNLCLGPAFLFDGKVTSNPYNYTNGRLIQTACNNLDAQKWEYTSDKKLKNKLSGYCIQPNSTSNDLYMWYCDKSTRFSGYDDDTDQKWDLY
jgi:hypothetical protein